VRIHQVGASQDVYGCTIIDDHRHKFKYDGDELAVLIVLLVDKCALEDIVRKSHVPPESK